MANRSFEDMKEFKYLGTTVTDKNCMREEIKSRLISGNRSRGSSVSIVSDYGLDDRAIGVRSPAGEKVFPLASVSRPALRPNQRPVHWVPGVLSPGQSAAGAWRWPLTHIYCRGREWVGVIPRLPQASPLSVGGLLCCCFLFSGNACYHSGQSLLSSRLLSRNVKVKIYIKNIILPVSCMGVKVGLSH
jgi:hypothetical protein